MINAGSLYIGNNHEYDPDYMPKVGEAIRRAMKKTESVIKVNRSIERITNARKV